MKQNQKWLSMLFAFLLLFSSLVTPITTYADSSVDKNQEVEVDLNQEDDSEEEESDISEEEQENNETNDVDQAITEEVDQVDETSDVKDEEAKETTDKKATSETKERAPPVTVDVRVETHEKTLVPTTELSVESFELMEYINNNNGGSSAFPDEPRTIHAIIQALETVDGLDLKDDSQFGLGSEGNYIQSIDGLGEFSNGGMDGWMYFIDNSFAPAGVLDTKLEGGESIVLYYVADYMDNTFSWFDNEDYSVGTGEPLELTLNGVKSSNVNPAEGASILIDEATYKVDGEVVETDENGKVNITFDEPGTYHVSAYRDQAGNHEVTDFTKRNIIRPYAIVEVTEDSLNDKEDTTPPTLEVEGINDGDVVSKSVLEFTVKAMDDIDGEIAATVEVNEQVIEEKDNRYKVELNEGTNNIVVSATDKAENKVEKLYEITYQLEKDLEDINLDEQIDKTVNYVLSNGVNSEWQAVVLARLGIEIPESYKDKYLSAVQNSITEKIDDNSFLMTDVARLAIAGSAIDEDITNINGTNLLELIYNSEDNKMTNQGVNGPIFSLIALNSKDYKIPKDAKWTEERLINEIIDQQAEEGFWGFGSSPVIDYVGMALIALAPYKEQPEVKESIDKAVEYIQKEQTEEGYVGNFGKNMSATAQLIIGLSSVQVDVKDDSFVKDNGSLFEYFIKFAQDDGSFVNSDDYPGVISMATEQALQALVAYDLFLKDEGRIYEFGESIPEEDEEVIEVIAKIEALPSIIDITLKETEAVEDARTAYNQLSKNQQALVENYSKLQVLEERLTELENEIQEVEEKINALPNEANLTLKDKQNVKEARTAYDQLNEEQKGLVSNLDKLELLEAKLIQLEEEEHVEPYNIQDRIDKTAQYMLSNPISSEWQAIGLVKAGKVVPESYRDTFYNHVESQIENAETFGRMKITDVERLTIAAVAIGEDPTDINGNDLIDLIYNSTMRGQTDSMLIQGNNGPIFALIALNTNNYPEPFDAKWNREKLIAELLKNQKDDGSWSLSGTPTGPTSIDITAMAISGLAPYKDQPKVKAAIEGAIDYLSTVQGEEGGFTESFVGGTSSEATSQAIIGLTAYGMDPTDEKFTKNGNNLIDHLLTYQNEDGGFGHLPNTGANAMATEQALQGLVAYNLFLKGEGRLYEFNNFTDNNEEKIKEIEAIIDALPKVVDFTLEQKDLVLEARKTFHQLTDLQKSQVSNLDKLTKLEDKLDALEKEQGQVIKRKLQEKLQEAKALNTSNKTEASVVSLEKSIVAAESVLENDKATEEDVNKAIKGLEEAIEGLEDKPVEKVDKSKINTKINEAKKIDLTNKTSETVEAFKNALGAAEWIMASPDVSQKDTNKALDNLQTAMDNLEEINKEQLEELLNKASKTNLEGKTEASKKKLADAIASATSVLENKTATEKEVEKAIANLNTAVNNLVDVDKTKLEELLIKASETNLDGKTEASKKQLTEAMDEATSVSNNQAATEKDVKDAISKLNKATDNLVDVNKNELKEIIEKAKVSKIGKTAPSQIALNKAIKSAEAVLDNDAATEKQVAEAITAIEKAIANLIDIIVLVEPKQEKPVNAGETVKVKDEEKSVSIKLPIDLPENTKITVELIDEEIDKEDRKAVGTIVDVKLDIPKNNSGDENKEFVYILTLEVNDDITDEMIAIYHYNEENESWEYVGGEIHDDGTISVPVTHFSKYGVFVVQDGDIVEPETPAEVDKTELEEILAEAEATNTKDKTTSSKQDLERAIKSGNKVLLDKTATQADVDKAIKAIEIAIANLKDIDKEIDNESEKPKEETNNSTLKDKTQDAQNINDKKYTKQSIKALEKALSNAKAILDNEQASEEDIAEAIKMLEQALEGLVEKSKNESTEEKSETNVTPKVDEDDQQPKVETNKNEDNLPNTATPYYTLIFIGVVLLMIAAMMVIVQRRKASK